LSRPFAHENGPDGCDWLSGDSKDRQRFRRKFEACQARTWIATPGQREHLKSAAEHFGM
jgi:hypothetical protein